MWGSRDPVAVDNFPLPAEVGVIGHHTHWDECFTLQDCIKVNHSSYDQLLTFYIKWSFYLKRLNFTQFFKEVQKVQNFHMGPDRNWWDLGYNFLIGGDGRIYEGRGFNVQELA